jgi:hypothetical protein
MVLRCAENMLVANNTFDDIQYFVFAISHRLGGFGGSIEGLRVVNNVVVTVAGKIYGVDTALPASVVLDNNVIQNTSGGYVASVAGKGSTRSLDTFRSWTGEETSGIQGDPRFVDPAGRDFRLAADSPAIDRGMLVAPTTDAYMDLAPDIGRYERGS